MNRKGSSSRYLTALLLCVASLAGAQQEPAPRPVDGCRGLSFSAALLTLLPGAEEGCSGAVSHEGQTYAVYTIEVVRRHPDYRVEVRFPAADDDSNRVHVLTVPRDLLVPVDDRPVPLAQVGPGQQLIAYVDPSAPLIAFVPPEPGTALRWLPLPPLREPEPVVAEPMEIWPTLGLALMGLTGLGAGAWLRRIHARLETGTGRSPLNTAARARR